MTTSGTSSFNETRDQIITRALRQCSAIQAGEIPEAVDIQTCSEALNAMVKEWDTIGIHIWTETEGVLFPQPFQYQYFFGPGSVDHGTTTWLLASLAQPIKWGATQLYLNVPLQPFGQPLIFNGDQIGIVLDNGFVFWTTVTLFNIIDSVNPYLTDENNVFIYSGDPYRPLIYTVSPLYPPQLTLIITLTDPVLGTAQAGNFVFDYTVSFFGKPLRVISTRRFYIGPGAPQFAPGVVPEDQDYLSYDGTNPIITGNPQYPLIYVGGGNNGSGSGNEGSPFYSSQIDTPMLVYSRLDYRELPNKNLPGVPTAFFYDPQLGTGQYFLWPAPSNVWAVFRFTWWRKIEDFNSGTDNPDLPVEWLNCLAWNLAEQIALEYDCPIQKYTLIQQQAARSLDRCTGFDREPEPTYFGIANSPSSR